MRHQDNRPFAEHLNKLREGTHTTDDLQTLHSRVITSDNADYPMSAQHLFKTNAKVNCLTLQPLNYIHKQHA